MFDFTHHHPYRILLASALGLALLGSCRQPPRVQLPDEARAELSATVTNPWQRVEQVRTIENAHTVPIQTIAIDPAGKFLATGSARMGKLWQLPEATEIVVIDERNNFDALAFSPDGQTVASGDYFGRVTLFEMNSGKSFAELDAHEHFITQLHYSPDGRYIATSSLETNVKLWDVRTQELIRTFPNPDADEVFALAFSADGRYLVSGSFRGGLWLWDVESGDRVRGYVGHQSPVNAVAIDPQDKFIVSGSFDETLKVWDVQTGLLRRTLQGHTDAVSDVAISPDGKTIASSSRDRTIRLWDADTGTAIATLEGAAFRRVAFVPDGRLLVGAAEDGTLWFWQPMPAEVVAAEEVAPASP